MIEACVFYSLIGALDPKLAFNDGMRDVVKFVYAPNTVTNASAPAPVSSYQAANQKLTDVILEALAPFRPERALANSGSSGAMLISWKDGGRPGQPSASCHILGSAFGGGNGNDGASAVATHTSNLHITPNENSRNRISLPHYRVRHGAELLRRRRIPRWARVPAHVRAVAGRRRHSRYDRAKFPPNGVAGGKPGSRSRFVIHLGAEGEPETPASGRYELRAGERFLLQGICRRWRLRRSKKTRSCSAQARYRGRLRLGRFDPARFTAARIDRHGRWQERAGWHRRRRTHGIVHAQALH